jgi:hypothetical protein
MGNSVVVNLWEKSGDGPALHRTVLREIPGTTIEIASGGGAAAGSGIFACSIHV